MVSGSDDSGNKVYVEQHVLTELMESKKRYADLFEHMLHEVHIWRLVRNEDGSIRTWTLVDANPAALKTWGKPLDEIVGKTTDEIFPDSNATDLFMPVVEKIFREGEPHIWETHFPATDQFLHMISIPYDDYFISTGLDISNRKAMEDELRDTLVQLRQAIMAGNVGLWDWNLETNKVYFSPEWKKQIGYSDKEISNDFQEWQSRVHPDDIEDVLKAIRKSIEEKSTSHEVEFRFKHKDGSYRNILAHASTVKGENGDAIRMIGSHIDVTKQKQMESAIVQAQKMDAIGALAGGIAHDFNNVLSIISGNLALLNDDSLSSDMRTNALHDMQESVDRGTSLTRQLITFAKGGIPEATVFELGDLVKTLSRLSLSGSTSTCNIDIQDDLWYISADESQISQVFSNLIINAKQSMPDGGTISISLKNSHIDASQALPLAAGDYIEATITDEGEGISTDQLSKIFDPFFTTKKEGTGLGLSTTYSIVKRHGGCILVNSVPDQGTTFTVYLPAETSALKDASSAKASEDTSHGRILMIDDEPVIQVITQRMLDELGYEPVVCESSSEAIARYRDAFTTNNAFNLVILSLTTSDAVTAEEVVAQLREINPDMKAIALSGYSVDPVAINFKDYGFCGAITKPFKMAELSRALKDALG